MIKTALTIFCLSLCTMSYLTGQIEITKGKFPYNKVIEWPGKGTLFLGDDPSGNSQEIHFNLLNHSGETQWIRSVYPKNSKTHLIVSALSDYIYFVDDLSPVNNKIRYNQVNQSGSIVPANFDVLQIIRSYGYTTPKDLQLKEIVNTPKALVFYFQFLVKDKKIIENIFVAITHHNNRVYHCKGPVSSVDLIKNGREDEFVFAGADEELIYFSRFYSEEKNSGVSFFSFTPKAEPKPVKVIKPTGLSPLASEVQFVDLKGSYYLFEENKKNTIQSNGNGIFFNGKFYYVANDSQEACLKIYGQNDKGHFTQLTSCSKKADPKKIKEASISIVPFQDKLVIVGAINDQSIAYEIKENGVEEYESSVLDFQKIRNNPSSIKDKNNSNKFVHYINGVPYYLDLSSLEKSETIQIFK